VLDIVFTLLGWTRSGLGPALLQWGQRLNVMVLTWSLCPPDSLPIYITIIAFSLIEIIRFPFYTLKQLETNPSFLQRFFGNLRYNIFIIIYPLGAGCELLASF